MTCVNTLKQKGFKLTPQRRLIADIIHDTVTHLTADEIIAHAQERMPGVDKSTVYRTLDLFEEAGCVFKSRIGDTFVYHHADEGHHHHLVCRRPGLRLPRRPSPRGHERTLRSLREGNVAVTTLFFRLSTATRCNNTC